MRMNRHEFKKEFQVKVKKFGFEFHNRDYYYNLENLIIVINCQKSNYSDSYYINYGFFVKSLHNCFSYPKISECDVMGRFENSMKSDLFELATIDVDELKRCIDANLAKVILPVMNEGIMKYFELFPQTINAAKLNLKCYLENVGKQG